MAALLDAYGVRWEYEPVTFVLAADAQGRPLRAFTPDFYLPDHDVYVEVTSMRPRLVHQKRAKVRALAALRPDVRVMLVERAQLAELARRLGRPLGEGASVSA